MGRHVLVLVLLAACGDDVQISYDPIPVGTCDGVVMNVRGETGTHVPFASAIEWSTNPPSTGSHCPRSRVALAVMLAAACSDPAVTPDAGVPDATPLPDELVISPVGFDFGDYDIGSDVPATRHTFSITNRGEGAATLTAIAVGGPAAADFVLAANSCGETLAPADLSIAPSGNIYPCVRWVKEDDDSVPRLGDVWRGLVPEELARIRAEAATPKQPCGDCSYNDGRCANECACEHYSATGRIDTPAPALCEHERVMVPIADRVGNTLWRDGNPVFMQKLYPQLVQLRVRSTDEEEAAPG